MTYPYRLLSALAVLAVPSPSVAAPFTLRTVPAGLDFAATDAYDKQPPMAADFDRDGHRDWYWGGSVISRFPKSGTLALPAITISQYPAATVVPLAGAVLDVDLDGDMDIVRINRWDGWSDTYTLQVFLNDGAGAFTAGWRSEWSGPSFNEGKHFYQMVPGDYDRDGDEDLALLSAYGSRNYGPSPARFDGSVRILWNHSAQFGNSTMVQSHGFTNWSHLEAGDLDRDGDLDLICSDQNTVTEDDTILSHSRTFINGGSGTFTGTTESAWTYEVLLRDVNRDGWPDLLSQPGGSDTNLYWQENNKTGGFKGRASYYSGGSQYPGAFALADANEDGILDLVIAEGPSLAMRPGQGNGYYGAPVIFASLPSSLAAIGADDLDCDGDQDFLLRFDNGTFRFLENRAPRLHPGFAQSTVTLSGIQKLEVADMNRDGKPDVLALEPGDNKIHLLAGQSNGLLAAPEFKLTVNQSASDFTVADFNRDGRPDLAYTLPGSGQVRQILQSDSIYFSWPDTKVGDLPGVSMIRAGDAASTNGSPDLMTASAGTVRWYVNNGSASAWTASDVLTGISPPPLGILPAAFNPRWGDIGYHLSADGALGIKGHQHFFSLTPPWIQLHQLLQVHDQPQTGEMIAADLDRDGLPEIVFGNGNGDLVWWKPTCSSNGRGVAMP
ncbi:MAG: VCBS repeat-containing protein [Verrucomicrobiaceae bacterium]|nr:MAG: VCBS repeat-containing protein [Verrucomicrobiaceae bacterium]